MQGLADEQIEELKLKDEWADKCLPNDHVVCPDQIGRRNGQGKRFYSVCIDVNFNVLFMVL